MRILTFFYPGWQLYAGATPLALSAQSETGLMLADIPSGTYELVLRFEDSPQRTAAKWVSALGLLFLLIALWRLPRPTRIVTTNKVVTTSGHAG